MSITVERIAFVAGATGDIGRSVTARLLDTHSRVFAVARAMDRLALLKNEFGTRGLVPIQGDLRDLDFMRKAVDVATEGTHRLDTLVHCQGYMPSLARIGEVEADVFDEVFGINLRSPVMLTRFALPALRQAQGSVVFIGSIAGAHANALMAAYGASKAALTHFSKTLAHEEGPLVRSNVVAPGWVDSEMMHRVLKQFSLEPEAVLGRVPLRRAAKTSEVAELIHWLTSSAGNYVNGASFSIDGGGQP
jgi:NAD(P)-dependent dehydrogenase (short-subunit alcohol dehydrogenase family)